MQEENNLVSLSYNFNTIGISLCLPTQAVQCQSTHKFRFKHLTNKEDNNRNLPLH